MPDHGFPGRFKLIKADEFSSVFSFRRRIFGEYLALHYLPNRREHPRLGIVVGKKTAKRAVARNYIRRVVREWFRQNREKVGCYDIVIRANKAFDREEFHLIMAELEHLLGRLQRAGAKQAVPNGANDRGASADLAG